MSRDWFSYHLTIEPVTAENFAATWTNPETRWFARRKLRGLVATGVLAAASWEEPLHPRGRDGKFITKYGFVRWLSEGAWKAGWVQDIDPNTGAITVRDRSGNKLNFPDARYLYSQPRPKAKLDLPDVKSGHVPEKW